MSEPQNLDVVRRVYEAFGRGDLEEIVAPLDPDVTWRTPWVHVFTFRNGRIVAFEEPADPNTMTFQVNTPDLHRRSTVLVTAFPLRTRSMARFTSVNGKTSTRLSTLCSAANASIALMSLRLPT